MRVLSVTWRWRQQLSLLRARHAGCWPCRSCLHGSVFEHRAFGQFHGEFPAPTDIPEAGIGDREFIADGLRAGAGDFLDDLAFGSHAHVRAARCCPVRNASGLDHQGIAFPAAPGIALPAGQAAEVGPALCNRYHTRVVDHLGHEDHLIFALRDLHVGVVAHGAKWRTFVGPDDAALGNGTVLRAVVFMPLRSGAHFVAALLRVGAQRRQAAVGGQRDDEVRRLVTISFWSGFRPNSPVS